MKSISSKRSLFAALACVPSVVAAQYGNATASANASTISFHDPTGVSTTFATKSFNYSLASTYSVQTDFSNERLAALWQQVGPIAAGPVTTTVSPTPESSPLARPGVMHPYIPSYEANLSNAKLPENFIWGVASSAYQIEVCQSVSLNDTYLRNIGCSKCRGKRPIDLGLLVSPRRQASCR